MFATEARVFIRKLIRMQQVIEQKGYVRNDQPSVRKSREHLKLYLDYYRYEQDEQMRGFWNRNEEHIRTLLPAETHPGFKSIMDQYLKLKPQ